MGPDAVAKLIVISILAPLAAGIGFRKVAPTIAGRIAGPLGRIAGIVLLAGVLCILAFALPTAWTLMGSRTIIAIAAFVIVGLAAGHFFGGPGSEQKVTLALSTASRHPALGARHCGRQRSGRTPCGECSAALPRCKRSGHDSIRCLAAQEEFGGRQRGVAEAQEFCFFGARAEPPTRACCHHSYRRQPQSNMLPRHTCSNLGFVPSRLSAYSRRRKWGRRE
jgi:hypothetical protein